MRKKPTIKLEFDRRVRIGDKSSWVNLPVHIMKKYKLKDKIVRITMEFEERN